jgi:hypothetical protein
MSDVQVLAIPDPPLRCLWQRAKESPGVAETELAWERVQGPFTFILQSGWNVIEGLQLRFVSSWFLPLVSLIQKFTRFLDSFHPQGWRAVVAWAVEIRKTLEYAVCRSDSP